MTTEEEVSADAAGSNIMKTKAGEAPLPFIYENFPKEL
jgi:hypothetical protein